MIRLHSHLVSLALAVPLVLVLAACGSAGVPGGGSSGSGLADTIGVDITASYDDGDTDRPVLQLTFTNRGRRAIDSVSIDISFFVGNTVVATGFDVGSSLAPGQSYAGSTRVRSSTSTDYVDHSEYDCYRYELSVSASDPFAYEEESYPGTCG